MQKGINTRFIVYKILFSLKISNSNYDDIFNKYITEYNLSLRDKKMIHNITLTSMRFDIYAKKILRRYIKKKINIKQYILFLSAITQIVFLDFKEYAVVNSTVELSKNKQINIHSGFINAVLKQIIKDKKLLVKTSINYKEFE